MRLPVAFVTIVALVALMLIALMPLGIALAQQEQANPDRILPEAVQRGETFDVTVNFTSPVDMFNSAGLTDLAPDGWNVMVDEVWSTPNADVFTAIGNKAEIAWYGEPGVGFDKDISFSALYKVTVPDDAPLGIYTFNGFLEYWVASEGPYSENITGSSQVEVVEAGIGLWWIVGIVVGIAIIVAAVLLVRRRRA